MPRVSVIIPTYNRAKYICEAINSLLNQTYKDYEIIVIDDGSTDNTKEIISGYKERILYIYQDNLGPAAARNRGIKIARGEYVSFLDSDDTFLPEKLESQVGFLDNNPSTSAVHTWWYYTDSNGKTLPFKGRRSYNKNIRVENMLIGKVSLNLCAFMFRKSCFNDDNLFDETLCGGEDWDLWLRLAEQGHKFYCIPKVLVAYRMHKDNMVSNIDKMFNEGLRWREKYFNKYACLERVKKKTFYNFYYEFSWNYYYSGNYDMFKKNLGETINLFPETLNKSATFIQWAYNHIPLKSRCDRKVFENVDIIGKNIFNFLDYYFSTSKQVNKSIEKNAYANSYIALAHLYYFARRSRISRRYFLKGFGFYPLTLFSFHNVLTFLKSMMGDDAIKLLSKHMNSMRGYRKRLKTMPQINN